MLTERERIAFHRNTTLDGRPLTAEDREVLMKPFLPPPTSSDISSSSTAPTLPPRARRAIAQARKQKSQTQRRKPIRSAIRHQLHVLAFTIISALFGIFVRLRKAYHAIFDRVFVILYYHHRSPEHIRNDVKKLNKLPEHLSVILQLDAEEDRTSALEKLIHDVGEVTAWSASAGIPVLSIYERTGIGY
jgi:dehydrodolichyl diphosphate syntase complex subunit NUS1